MSRRGGRRSCLRSRSGLGTAAALAIGVAALVRLVATADSPSPAPTAAPATVSQGPSVRVGVVESATHIRVIAYGAFSIVSSAGRAIFRCEGPSVVRFASVDGTPGTYYYYVVASEFTDTQKREARRLLAHLRESLRVGMEILPSSDRLAEPRGHSEKGDRLLVAVGPFDQLELAEQWREYLSGTYPAYIAKDTSERATGEIQLYDGHDRLLARMKDSVVIRTSDEAAYVTADRLQSPAGGWASKSPAQSRYRGPLEIRLNDDGEITAINVVPMEEYVRGVVPAEIGGGAPTEALKAQAVAARSEALFKLKYDRHPGELYDFCDGWHCQVYHGVSDQTKAANAAVQATRGMVLVNGSDVIDAVYCHSCGGVTADSRDVWRSSAYPFYQAAFDRRLWRKSPDLSGERKTADWVGSNPDVYCNPTQRGFPEYAKKYFRWKRTLKASEIEERVNRYGEVGRILDLIVEERAASGRVRVLRVEGTERTQKFTGVDTITRVLGGIPSSFFVMAKSHESSGRRALTMVTIRGGGFGHGVGMCQMGAYMMARRGYTFQQILDHYYPNTSLRKAY